MGCISPSFLCLPNMMPPLTGGSAACACQDPQHLDDVFGAGTCGAGINLVLISRTESKLQAVSTELEAANKIQTKIIAADFSRATEETWDSISAVSAWGSVPFEQPIFI